MHTADKIETVNYDIKVHPPKIKRIFHNKMLMVGGILVIIVSSMAIFAPVLTTYDPAEIDVIHRLEAPSWQHWMGTDQYGRDIMSRILYGARVSLEVGMVTSAIGIVIGVFLGAIAGFLKGYIDTALMRVMDAIMSFPPLLLSIAVVAAVGPSMLSVAFAIGVVYIPSFSRIMRSSVLGEAEKEYVEAAKAIGQKKSIILLKHIGPNCLSPIFVMATVAFANAVLIEAGLNFIGIGVPPPTPSLGLMLEESRKFLSESIYLALFPGITISAVVLGLNLFGDGLRDFFDPKNYANL